MTLYTYKTEDMTMTGTTQNKAPLPWNAAMCSGHVSFKTVSAGAFCYTSETKSLTVVVEGKKN